MKGQKQFYLLQCSPHFHQSVLLQLSRSGIAYYNPVIRTFYKRRDCSAYRGQIMPMFPGYVFVLLDFEVVHPSCFTRMKNVYGLVSFGEYPAEVPLSVINEVKEQEKIFGTVAKLAMRQPFVLFKGLTFQKLCLPGAFRPGDHHNKMLRPGLCVVHASPQYL